MTNAPQPSKNTLSRNLAYGTMLIVVGFLLIQTGRFFIPEFQLDNPPVTNTIQWDSPETEQLWNRACADCHSNETVYPWYSYVAPVGWLIAHDTHEGREELNISVDRNVELHEMIEVIQEGEMPMPIYTLMHPDANLSAGDRQALIDGLRATFGNNGIDSTGTDSHDD